jgi:purine-cytosine permease-like protein
MTAELAALDKKITVVGYRLITGLSLLMVVIAALLFAALHYWPPHSSP